MRFMGLNIEARWIASAYSVCLQADGYVGPGLRKCDGGRSELDTDGGHRQLGGVQ